MGMKPYHNIFFYYRGAQPPGGQAAADAQLENNTTKALVNLLEYGGERLLHAFLREIDPSVEWPKVAAMPKMRMQTDGRLISASRKRFVVAITPEHPQVGLEASIHQDGLPDALLYAESSFGVIIESKVAAPLVDAQLQRHAASARWDVGTYQRVHLTWQGIFRCFQSLKLTGTPAFLRDQFLEYLRLIELAPFDGFRAQDFDHFIGDDPEYRGLLRARLRDFASLVFPELPASIRERYVPEPHVGKVTTERGAWVSLPRDQSKPDPFNHCNFTIELTASALSFNTVLRDGRASDPKKPIGLFRARLEQHPDWFINYLRELGRDFALQVYRRTNAAGADKILPGSEHWHLILSQRLDLVLPEGLVHVRRLLEAIPFPGIHLSFELPRGRVLKMTPGDLNVAAVGALTRLHPFVQFVESGRELAAGDNQPVTMN